MDDSASARERQASTTILPPGPPELRLAPHAPDPLGPLASLPAAVHRRRAAHAATLPAVNPFAVNPFAVRLLAVSPSGAKRIGAMNLAILETMKTVRAGAAAVAAVAQNPLKEAIPGLRNGLRQSNVVLAMQRTMGTGSAKPVPAKTVRATIVPAKDVLAAGGLPGARNQPREPEQPAATVSSNRISILSMITKSRSSNWKPAPARQLTGARKRAKSVPVAAAVAADEAALPPLPWQTKTQRCTMKEARSIRKNLN